MQEILIFITFGLLCGFIGAWGETLRTEEQLYTVETFTPDLTIRIQCSGDCDLAAMIAEAKEAAAK